MILITQNQKYLKMARRPSNNSLIPKELDIISRKFCSLIRYSLQRSHESIDARRIDGGDAFVNVSLWLVVVAQLVMLAFVHGTLLN